MAERLPSEDVPAEDTQCQDASREQGSPPEVLPLLPRVDQVYYPIASFSLWANQPQSVKVIQEAWAQARYLFLVAQKAAEVEEPGPEHLYDVGTVAMLTGVEPSFDAWVRADLKGIGRARVRHYLPAESACRVRVAFLVEEDPIVEEDALTEEIIAECHRLEQRCHTIPADLLSELTQIRQPGLLADTVAPFLPLPLEMQQTLLETLSGRERLGKLHAFLRDEERLRAALVETLRREGSLPSAACGRAFLRVPRHRFLPDVPLSGAYWNGAITTRSRDEDGHDVALVSSSQPGVMATNVGQLRPRRGFSRVLEIGAGTGYNAAILAELVGREHVVSIDLEEEIVAGARANLDAAGYPDVVVDTADGWDGYPSRAPYDRILVTVGVHDLAPAWGEQLREGGVLVAWCSFRCAQLALALRKRNGILVSERARKSGPPSCCFVWAIDARGKQPRQTTRRFGESLTVQHDSLDPAQLAMIDALLDSPGERLARPELKDLWTPGAGFLAYLALAHPHCVIVRDPRLAAYGIEEHAQAWAILDPVRGQLAIQGYKVCFGGPEIGEELCRLADEWRALGQPELDRLVLAAYPRAAYPDAERLPAGRWQGLIEKEHTWFRWRYRRRPR